MKKGMLLIAVILWALCLQQASAKTLEDVLKEKGVITEEDYKEITKVKPIDYKLGKGFTFTTSDEKFQLSLGGRMQFRYTFMDNDGTRQDTSQWDAKRIRLWALGYAYFKDLTYNLEFDPRAYGADPKKGLINAYLDYRIVDEAQIRVGQYKDCFGRSEVTSDGALEFVDRSPVADAFKHGYDIGAMLYGKIAGGFAYYNVGVFGGAGQTNTRNSNDNAFIARIAVNPLGDMAYSEGDLDVSKKPLLSIGANFLMNTFKKTTPASGVTLDSTASNVSGWIGTTLGAATDKIDTDSYGADLAFKWMGLSLQAEYLLGQAEAQSNAAPLPKLKRAQGFYGQAGYMIIPKKLEVAFRYSYLDKNRDVSNDLITEQIGAVSYYFNKHNLKLQGDVGNIHTQGNQTVGGVSKPTDDMQYRVQAQIIF